MRGSAQKIDEKQLQSFGHMTRMQTDEKDEETKIATKRMRGRPRKTWNDTVEETLKQRKN